MAVYRLTGYDRTLMDLRLMTTELGMAVRQLLSGALEALRTNVHDNWHLRDEAIDLARDQIVERCFNIMGLQQLRDQELRWILGYQRIAQELERIADYACDVAELSELRPDRACPSEIWEMAVQLSAMFDDALASLKEGDKSSDWVAEDEKLDQIYARLQQELVRSSRNQEMNQELGFKLILARTLERMGDHVVNVGQQHYYVQTGQRWRVHGRLGGMDDRGAIELEEAEGVEEK